MLLLEKFFTKMKVNSYYISPRNQRRLEKKEQRKELKKKVTIKPNVSFVSSVVERCFLVVGRWFDSITKA
jgi:hypothetical protein